MLLSLISLLLSPISFSGSTFKLFIISSLCTFVSWLPFPSSSYFLSSGCFCYTSMLAVSLLFSSVCTSCSSSSLSFYASNVQSGLVSSFVNCSYSFTSGCLDRFNTVINSSILGRSSGLRLSNTLSAQSRVMSPMRWPRKVVVSTRAKL